MRVAFALAVMALFYAPTAFADDFGPRFRAQAPAGLGDYTAPETQLLASKVEEQNAEQLQSIEPAAGEEKVEVVASSVIEKK